MTDLSCRSLGVMYALIMIAMSNGVFADELPRARPEDVGFWSTRLDNIDEFYAEKIERGEMDGIVILVA